MGHGDPIAVDRAHDNPAGRVYKWCDLNVQSAYQNVTFHVGSDLCCVLSFFVCSKTNQNGTTFILVFLYHIK